MKHSFTKQAAEVKRLSKLVLKVDQEVLREAATSLAALALIGEKKILIVDELISVAEQFCSIYSPDALQFQNEFKKLLAKI